MFTPANSFVSLVKKMDILELEQKHGIEGLKKDIGHNKEQIRDMCSQFQILFAKVDARFETQFAKVDARFETEFAKMDARFDARFDRLERSLDSWLFKILGLVSYSHYSYSTTFSKGI